MSKAALSQSEFEALLNDPDVPDSQIAKYLRRKPGTGGFNIAFEPDPDLVEPDRAEAAMVMTIGNGWCRRRRRARFNRRLRRGSDLPVIVSEGDSWFQFPFVIDDVIDHLSEDYLVWSCGAAGDTAENMIFENPEYMEALDEQAGRVTAFMLSAAGNDVIGEDASGAPVLSQLLHKRTDRRDTARELVNKAALSRVIDGLREAYLMVIRTVRADSRFETLPILVHGYDYALPYPNSAGDRRNPFWADNDEWLGAPMAEKGIDSPDVRRDIIELLIQTLYDMLNDVARTDPHVHVVDARGTLTKVKDWADEIHGTSTGFRRVAAKFRKVLRSVVKPEISMARMPETLSAEPDLGDGYPAIESPPLMIESRETTDVDHSLMGFGRMDKFAMGFKRTADKITRASVLEVAIEEDDSVPFRYLAHGAERGRAVCKIKASGTNYRGQRGRWSGTGFLIAPNILLTNHHVINTPEVADASEAVFNFQETISGTIAPTSSFTLDPSRLFIASPFQALDYCLVWVNGAPQDQFGTVDFWRGSSMAPSGLQANIIHHPQGNPKRASLQKNEVIDLDMEEVLVHYTSDTEPGSSGSPVMTDKWRLFALHHASSGRLSADLRQRVRDAGYDSQVLNEGIKTSAIAIDIDQRAKHGPNQMMAQQVQAHLSGTDSRTGYFGSLGRSIRGGDGVEIVVDTYRGAPSDIDIAFWNIEWFNRDYRRKIDDVARIVADLNLDIWAFEETSPEATEELVEKMRHEFDLNFACAASEPGASSGKQTTTVMWNTRTVKGERLEWGREIDEILLLRSDDPDASRFEAVEGKIFNRYPGLFRFEALNLAPGQPKFDFNLVPVHLKAMSEGAKRRRMASKVLAAAVAMAQAAGMDENDWVIGGDINAELATGQFDALRDAGFTPMSAQDERGGAITYLGRRYRSLIDSMFLSPSLARGADANDFMIVAKDRADPGFINRVSDHRPIMIRLSIGEAASGTEIPDPDRDGSRTGDDEILSRFLRELRDDPPGTLAEIAELLRRRARTG